MKGQASQPNSRHRTSQTQEQRQPTRCLNGTPHGVHSELQQCFDVGVVLDLHTYSSSSKNRLGALSTVGHRVHTCAVMNARMKARKNNLRRYSPLSWNSFT